MLSRVANYFRWRWLSAKGRVRRKQSTVRELDSLWSVVQRNLNDAQVEGLSADRRFALAYSAALQLSSIAIAGAGYKVCGEAHHIDTFVAAKLALGREAEELIDYLQTCRRRRHTLEYNESGLIKPAEAEKLVQAVIDYAETVQKHTKS